MWLYLHRFKNNFVDDKFGDNKFLETKVKNKNINVLFFGFGKSWTLLRGQYCYYPLAWYIQVSLGVYFFVFPRKVVGKNRTFRHLKGFDCLVSFPLCFQKFRPASLGILAAFCRRSLHFFPCHPFRRDCAHYTYSLFLN